jgi:hypothetical protein
MTDIRSKVRRSHVIRETAEEESKKVQWVREHLEKELEKTRAESESTVASFQIDVIFFNSNLDFKPKKTAL